MENPTIPQMTTAPVSVLEDKGPVPMSFPAVLRTPGLSDRYSHLRMAVGRSHLSESTPYAAPKKSRRDEKEGKRWVRRKENARFIGNPHIVAASKKDLNAPPPSTRTTFPEPLPPYLSRNNTVPSTTPTTREPISANAGRFSLSLKGMRRDLRKSGPRTETLVKEVEHEITAWLTNGGVLLNPDDSVDDVTMSGSPVGTLDVITELSRTPLQLVWSITDDAFARYVVHCCARYHNIVSYSKEVSGQRLTYILRPNVTRPDFTAVRVLDTPPITDDSELSTFEYASESDFVSDRSDIEPDSDIEGTGGRRGTGALSDIAESAPASPLIVPIAPIGEDEWSVVGNSDGEAGDELTSSVDSLSIQERRIPLVETRGLRQVPLRANLWERQSLQMRRNASSPSRSPARRLPTRALPRIDPPSDMSGKRSFYDYLFA
ncbi:hypothetical protein QCA50_004045 [Cerrena zonata]|uniref:Uncharacterized protein n=1 Tax=Cerrena zonata TaxID=2478898 RepID=A0AAW0GMV4_9APHY